MNKSTLIIFCLFTFVACQPSKDKARSSNSDGKIPFASEMPPTTDGSDPLASFAWHLHNTGQSSFASRGGKAGEDSNVKEVHVLGITGKGIRIAVSDSGTEVSHPDLSSNALSGEHRSYSGAPSEWRGSDPTPEGEDGHGTAVTGLISAVAGNGIGSYGVAPDSLFAGFYFLGPFRDYSTSYEARTLDQLTGDFDIFNYSYGYPGCSFYSTSSSIVAAYKDGVSRLRKGLGAIYVKAAGNEFKGSNGECYSGDRSTYWGNTNTSEDQNHPYLIMTAASNAAGEISSYSSPGSGVWITSMGGEFGSTDPAMITTDLRGCATGISSIYNGVSQFNKGASPLNPNCSYTNAMNGTSSAAPTLAGIIALIMEANANLSWRDIKHILAVTAKPIKFSTNSLSHPGGASLQGHVYDRAYTVNSAGVAFSNTFGFGRVDALKAVEYATNYDYPLGTYVETESNGVWAHRSGPLNAFIPDASASGVNSTLSVSQNLKIESVQIKLSLEHPRIGELGVELTSPSGTVSKILLINSNIKDRNLYEYVMITNAFYQESSAGNWTLKVIDGSAGNTGRLSAWELKINGGSR